MDIVCDQLLVLSQADMRDNYSLVIIVIFSRHEFFKWQWLIMSLNEFRILATFGKLYRCYQQALVSN